MTEWLEASAVPGTDFHLCPLQLFRSKKTPFPNVETSASFPSYFRGELRIPQRGILDLVPMKSRNVFLKIISGGKWAH